MLKEMGVRFIVKKSCFTEPEHTETESPSRHVTKNAEGKARDVADRTMNALVIGADTVVVCNGKVLGKPATMKEAFEYMRMLNGKTHTVYTGLSIVETSNHKALTDYEKTFVTFRKLTEYEINAYLLSIYPLDKAGGYAIQGAGALIVKNIKGCYYNVVGFPLGKLDQMLIKKGFSLFQYIKRKQSI